MKMKLIDKLQKNVSEIQAYNRFYVYTILGFTTFNYFEAFFGVKNTKLRKSCINYAKCGYVQTNFRPRGSGQEEKYQRFKL